MACVEVEIGGVALDQLSESFFWEQPQARPRGGSDFGALYEVVARVHGLKVKILADEHPPPHFHVSYQGEDASFSIVDCSRLPGVRGLERYERRIRVWWSENRTFLIEKWNTSRPTNCPVGPVVLRE